jgi:glycosyltransferase involved in cell wall biosynthesis
MLSGDASILEVDSPAQRRMLAYAGMFETLHVVVACSPGTTSFRRDGLQLHPAPGRSTSGRWLQTLKKGIALCRGVVFDCISAQDPCGFGLVGVILSRTFQLPVQVQVHTDLFSPHYRMASWRERLCAHLGRFILPRAACIRTVSSRVADSIVRDLGIPHERVHVLPIFTDVRAIQSAPCNGELDERLKPYDFKLIAAGRFVEREKGYGKLIKAMADIVEMVPKTVLTLVGEGPDKPRYERMIRALDLSSAVMLEPWREDFASFMKSFDVYVLPSNFEGWGRGCVEAAAAGLAVVMTDVGLAGEVFRDGEQARVVPAGDTSALTKAIVELGSDASLRARLGRAGQRTVESLTPRSFDAYCREFRAAMAACMRR